MECHEIFAECSYICPLNDANIKKHNNSFEVCKDVLKISNLLHRWGIDDFQSNSTVGVSVV